MAERVYPAGKPAATDTDTNPIATTAAAFPATKAQLYNASRPAYRPYTPTRRRSRCCSCCLWTTLAIAVLLLSAAIAAAVLFLVYQPRKPTFAISNFKLNKLNLTKNDKLSMDFSISVLAKNPNKKIQFLYSPTKFTVFSSKISLGSGEFPSFTNAVKNTTLIKSDIKSETELEKGNENATSLKNEVKKNTLKLKIEMDTKVKVKIGKMKSKRVNIRVVCEGINVAVPSGKTGSTAVIGKKGKCKVDLRVKIWKWTF